MSTKDCELSVFHGGVDQLPFSGVSTPEEVIQLVKDSINSTEHENKLDKFTKEYQLWYTAFITLQKRFKFYLEDALRNISLYDMIGHSNHEFRIALAASNCIVRGIEIRNKLEALPRDYWAQLISVNRCRQHGIELIDAYPTGFQASLCERTGVCVCERGAEPPYMRGCRVGDATLLLPYESPPELG